MALTPDDLPPLLERRRAFLCTKCGSHECKPETIDEPHPSCILCGYMGFASDCDFNDAELRAYARLAVEQAVMRERERCAKACDQIAVDADNSCDPWDNGFICAAENCAAAIRAKD